MLYHLVFEHEESNWTLTWFGCRFEAVGLFVNSLRPDRLVVCCSDSSWFAAAASSFSVTCSQTVTGLSAGFTL